MTTQTTKPGIKRMREASMETYRSPEERAAMRCGLSDASALCDILEREIKDKYVGRGGKIKKIGMELSVIAKMCGDKIYEYRSRINVR